MAKKNTNFKSSSWDFLSEFLKDVSSEVQADLNVGLDKATEFLAKELERETPVKTGKTKEAWVKQLKYRNVKYINNTAVDENGIPILNILEFAKTTGKPFVRKLLKSKESDMRSIILAEMQKKNN